MMKRVKQISRKSRFLLCAIVAVLLFSVSFYFSANHQPANAQFPANMEKGKWVTVPIDSSYGNNISSQVIITVYEFLERKGQVALDHIIAPK